MTTAPAAPARRLRGGARGHAQALRAGGERPCAVVAAGPDEADGELAALEVAGLGDARPGSLVALRRGRDAVATAGRVVAETAPGTRAVSVLAASLWFCDAWDDLVGDGWRCRDARASPRNASTRRSRGGTGQRSSTAS